MTVEVRQAARVVPRPASTVALLRHGAGGQVEVLLTHRPPTMTFGPGLHVFPGGAVEGDDAVGKLGARSMLSAEQCAAAWAGDLEPGPALGHAVAAIRELAEEAGVLLASDDGRLRTDRLVPLSRWVTPPLPGSRRFDTRFYVAWLPDGAAITPHAGEVAAHEWIAPSVALERYAARTIDLWPPTSSTLAQLEAVRSREDVASLAPRRSTASPVVETVADGLARIRQGGVGGRPGRTGGAWLVGRERVVVVDPGDPSEAVLDAILGTVNRHGATIAAVAVTSADPDRCAGAVGLALVADVPLWASGTAAPRIGDEARVVGDNDRIVDGDVELVVREVDAGAGLALEVPSLGVTLPTDGRGTVGRGTVGRGTG